MHGAFLKKTLEKEKIGVLNLIEDEHYFTTLAFVAIDENGEREFSFSRKPGADTKLQADELNLELLQNCKIFHFGSLSLTAQPAHEATVTAVSHGLTLANGPHDSYYFNNPEKIIAGEPRYPSIDTNNRKLLYRHLNVIYIADFLSKYDVSANDIGIITFSKKYALEFLEYVKNKSLSEKELKALVPEVLKLYVDSQRSELIAAAKLLMQKVVDFEDDYYDSNNNEKKLLDVLLEEGIFPTYSFPRNVVGFSIENSKGDKVEQEPDRSLDMAISEYAPGRLIVVNKKRILRKNAITSNNIGEWLISLDEADNRGTERRLKAYYNSLSLK